VREKVGTVAVVLALVLAWGVGFLWFRGDLHLPTGKDAAQKSAKHSAAKAPTTAPPVSTKTPAAAAAYDGTVTLAQ